MEKEIYTTCTRDCPDGCGIIAHVKDGVVTKLVGHPEHEMTKGFLCNKAPRFLERVYSDERQLYPLRRKSKSKDAGWERITWKQALDLIADKIVEFKNDYGLLSILHYQRNGSWGVIKDLGRRFWNLLGGVTTTTGSICSGAVRAGQCMDFGMVAGHDPVDLLNSQLVMIWGRNPVVTNIHLVPFLKQVRKKGGRVILIDPVCSDTAEICDEHIQVLPNRDAELAMAMAKVIIEEKLESSDFLLQYTAYYEEYKYLLDKHSLTELVKRCGLPESSIRQLAREYAKTTPSAIILGWGLNKYRSSAETVRLIDALVALCGNIGIPGGGSTNMYDIKRHLDKTVMAEHKSVNGRKMLEPLLGREILEAKSPPIKMIYVNACNPVNQLPNSNLVAQALQSLDFVVVADQFLTDTADYADLFLPTTVFLEEQADILVAYGHNILGGVNQVVDPPGEVRSDLWIFQELACRLGFGEEMRGSEKEWLKRLFAPLEQFDITVEQILESPVRCPFSPLVPYKDQVFPTPTGKFEFINTLEDRMVAESDYPLTLVTSMAKKWVLSQVLSKYHPDQIVARIGYETSSKYGVRDGQKALVESKVGSLEVLISVDNRVGPSLVIMEVGTWIKFGGGPNILTDDIISNHGNMAAYYETSVAIKPIMTE